MSKEYDEYLIEHIRAVEKAAAAIVNELPISRWATDDEAREFLKASTRHDEAKFRPEEYDAYDAYFYGDGDEEAFNLAWLHHIHHSPHHWQHWVLIMDTGEAVALEMPVTCALEMVADWWSFSWRSGDLTEILGWYGFHKRDMLLHERTRELVDDVIAEIGKRYQ